MTSAYHHTNHSNHWHRLWGISPIMDVKSKKNSGQLIPQIQSKYVLWRWNPIYCILRRRHWKCEVARVRRNFRPKQAPRDVTLGEARETALASSIIFAMGNTGWNWKCHIIIVIKTDLSGFVVTMNPGLCEQYIQSLGLTASGLDFMFARALMHCDNKPLPNRSWSLNHYSQNACQQRY